MKKSVKLAVLIGNLLDKEFLSAKDLTLLEEALELFEEKEREKNKKND